MAAEIKVIRVPHPSNDGTWVEFHGWSIRQKEVLEYYEELYNTVKHDPTNDPRSRKYLD